MQISFYFLSRDDVCCFNRRNYYFSSRRSSLLNICFKPKLRKISESSSEKDENQVVKFECETNENNLDNKQNPNWYYEENNQDDVEQVNMTTTNEHRESICDVLFSAKKQSPSIVSLKSSETKYFKLTNKSLSSVLNSLLDK